MRSVSVVVLTERGRQAVESTEGISEIWNFA